MKKGIKMNLEPLDESWGPHGVCQDCGAKFALPKIDAGVRVVCPHCGLANVNQHYTIKAFTLKPEAPKAEIGKPLDVTWTDPARRLTESELDMAEAVYNDVYQKTANWPGPTPSTKPSVSSPAKRAALEAVIRSFLQLQKGIKG